MKPNKIPHHFQDEILLPSKEILDIVVPIYCNTANNAHLLIERFRKTNPGQSLRFTFVCDSEDPSFEWLQQLSIKSKESVHVISTQSYVNEEAFYNAIKKYSQIHPSRYKWYWQQFKKLLAYQIPGIGNKIILWDSDTFPVNRQTFFNGNTPLCESSKAEYHIPYFITFANLTDALILPPHSSITQYAAVFSWELNHLARIFAFGSSEPRQIFDDHVLTFDRQKLYFERIFKSLAYCDSTNSLFADYEFINLYRLLNRNPYLVLKKRHFRYGGWIPLPKIVVIKLLRLLSYSNVSFERYHPVERLRLARLSFRF